MSSEEPRLGEERGASQLALTSALVRPQVLRDPPSVVALLGKRLREPDLALVVPDVGLDPSDDDAGRARAVRQVPILSSGEALVPSAQRLDDLAAERARCLDCVVPDVEALLEDAALREEALAERTLGDDHGAHVGALHQDVDKVSRDRAFEGHVGVDEDHDVTGRERSAAIALR